MENEFFELPRLAHHVTRFKKFLRTSPDTHVLLQGPRGVGKGYFLQILEKYLRKSELGIVNCAAIAPELISSYLFGTSHYSTEGSGNYTKGLIEIAEENSGVLVLEELDSLSHQEQSKLLSFLDTGNYFPVGNHQCKRSHVKIVAILDTEKKNKIRVGLIERFGIVVDVPPLYQRRDDIFYFIAKKYPELTLTSLQLLEIYNHNWPGNLRELDRFLFEKKVNGGGRGFRVVATMKLDVFSEQGFKEECTLVCRLVEAYHMLIRAGMDGNLFETVNKECFGKVLPAINDLKSDEIEHKNLEISLVDAPLTKLKICQVEHGPGTTREVIMKIDQTGDTHIINQHMVMIQVLDKKGGVAGEVSSMALSDFMKIIFGDVSCEQPISKQEVLLCEAHSRFANQTNQSVYAEFLKYLKKARSFALSCEKPADKDQFHEPTGRRNEVTVSGQTHDDDDIIGRQSLCNALGVRSFNTVKNRAKKACIELDYTEEQKPRPKLKASDIVKLQSFKKKFK